MCLCVFYTTVTPETVQAECVRGQSLGRCGVFRGQSQGRCGVFPRHRGQARDGHVGRKTEASLPRGPAKQQAIKQILSPRGAPANGVSCTPAKPIALRVSGAGREGRGGAGRGGAGAKANEGAVNRH